LGFAMADLAPNLNISQPAVSMSAQRGEQITSENGYSLMNELNLIILGASRNPNPRSEKNERKTRHIPCLSYSNL
jgi:hypothetical protein